jgi:HEAT repeat protein
MRHQGGFPAAAAAVVAWVGLTRGQGPAAPAGQPDRAAAWVVPYLKDHLDATDPGVRVRAARGLGVVGPGAREAVPALAARLADPAAGVRAAAAEALGQIGPEARATVPGLTTCLADRARRVREAAAEALGRIGSDAAPAVPAMIALLGRKDTPYESRNDIPRHVGRIGASAVPSLIEALGDADPKIVKGAVEALGEIGAPAAAAIPHFERLLGAEFREDGGLWLAVACNLGQLGPGAFPATSRALRHPNTSVRINAASRFGAFGAPAAPILLSALRRNDTNMVSFASGLGEIGPAALPALSLALCTDPDPRVRQGAALALGNMTLRTEAPRAERMRALLAALGDRDDDVRFWATQALGSLGAEARAALPTLITMLQGRDRRLTGRALGIIERIGPEARAAVPHLIAVLESEDSELHSRESVARALARIGPEARAAVPALRSAWIEAEARLGITHNVDRLVRRAGMRQKPTWQQQNAREAVESLRRASIVALWAIDPSAAEVQAPLLETLRKRDLLAHLNLSPEEQRWALPGRSAKIPPSGVPVLVRGLTRGEPGIRMVSAMLLGRAEPAPLDAVPALIDALADADASVRAEAAEALGRIGDGSRAATPVLIGALADDQVAVRAKAARALGKIAPGADGVVPALRGILGDRFAPVREAAAEALGQAGPMAEPAVAELVKVLRDSSPDVRAAAAEALGRIGSTTPEVREALRANLLDVSRVPAYEALARLLDGSRG